jgi:hypothetical protein
VFCGEALADVFCGEAHMRIENYFRTMFGPMDVALNGAAKGILGSEFAWLEQGIVDVLYSAPVPEPVMEAQFLLHPRANQPSPAPPTTDDRGLGLGVHFLVLVA